MRINISLTDEMVSELDKKAKSMHLTRSGYIAMALSYKMQTDEMVAYLPILAKNIQEAREIIDRKEREKERIE